MPKTNLCGWSGVCRRRFNQMFGWYEMIARLLPLLLLIVGVISDTHPPPNYAHNRLPNTSFSCTGKATGGYYADPEAGCQVFHVCVRVGPEEIKDFEFLCPNNTIFDQQNFICANYWEIDCKSSTKHYNKNDLFKVDETATTIVDYDNDSEQLVIIEYDYELTEPSITDQQNKETVEVQHRFNGQRTGKSQIGSGSQSNLAQEENPSTKSYNFFTTTTSTTVSTPSTYTTTKSKTTTPKITTRRPSYNLPFKPAFNVGKPVVSVSSTTSYEVGYASLKPLTSTTPSYGISTTNAIPFTNKRESQFTKSLNYKTTARTTTDSSRTADTSVITPDEFETTGSGFTFGGEDPFAHYDWKKDNSQIGVTASVRTTYEQRFGGSGGRPASAIRINQPSTIGQISTSSNLDSYRSTSSSVDTNRSTSSGLDGYRSKRRNNRRLPTTAPDHKAFSNFRYYKTAFGRSESVSTRNNSTNSKVPRLFPNYRSSASYNTRYSKYG